MVTLKNALGYRHRSRQDYYDDAQRHEQLDDAETTRVPLARKPASTVRERTKTHSNSLLKALIVNHPQGWQKSTKVMALGSNKLQATSQRWIWQFGNLVIEKADCESIATITTSSPNYQITKLLNYQISLITQLPNFPVT
jgi:hypothetical protein